MFVQNQSQIPPKLLHLIKGNFLGEHAPRPPSLPHALHTDMYFPPPNNPYNIILPPHSLGQKVKETLTLLYLLFLLSVL